MPRSGTSLAGQLVKKADDVVIFPELSPEDVPGTFAVLGETRRLLTAAAWRGFDEELIDARVLELLRRIWATGRPAAAAEPQDSPRFGLKQPNAELFHQEFATALGRWSPVYVYSVRDPADMYDSLLRMSRWGDLSPDAFARRSAASLQSAEAIRAADPDALFVLNIPRMTEDPDYRQSRGAELFARLELEPTTRFENFLKAWPPVNRSAGENRGDLSDGEIARRVEALRKPRRVRKLHATIDRLVS